MRIAPFLAIFLLLSGCAGADKDAAGPTSTEPPPLVPADADYGGIEGYVFGPDVLPKANVTIAVEDANKTVVTDATGYYVLMPLEPGTWVLVVNETGFQLVRRSVAITPGVGLRVDFALRDVPVPQPYIDDSFLRRGHIDCGVRAGTPDQSTNPDCTETPAQGQTEPYLPPGRGANLTLGQDVWAVLLELEWVGSVPVTNDVLRLAVRPTEGSPSWKQFEGTSVLRVELDEAQMAEFSEYAQKDYRANGGQVFFLVFPGEAAANSGYGAGGTFQQDYTLYVTVFYRMPIPADYSRLGP